MNFPLKETNLMKTKNFWGPLLTLFVTTSCNDITTKTEDKKPFQLVTLDPGHFHAALVQKTMYPDVASIVYVYAPESKDLQAHLDRVNSYNTRTENPTHWEQKVYKGSDFFDKMIADKKGNVIVLSGNNRLKTDYILKSLQNGFHVLADKPMVINTNDFDKLKKAFEVAQSQNLLLYDIMTERSEITTILQRELSMIPAIFGTLEKGTPDSPAITKESVHHFYKFVSGKVLVRPAWFLDTEQQGEGIVDVTTHLVDLVQWACFPEQIIDYTKDINIISAKRWTTDMGLTDFKTITQAEKFPDFLQKNVEKDTLLKVYCNGEINYKLKGVHAKTSVIWAYKAPDGTGDTHYSIMRGTRANLIIKQGAEEQYQPTLYIEPIGKTSDWTESFKAIAQKYEGVSLEKLGNKWKVVIPQKYKEGHEAHFARVTERYIEYLKKGNMPAWEVPNMIAKYYTTTKALSMAR